MISFESVSFFYSNKEILQNINFNLSENENITILGENGAGKSTIAKLMTGLLESNGNIKIFDEEITKIPHKKRAARINYIPAKLDVFDDSITLNEYILLGLYPYKNRFEVYDTKELENAHYLLKKLALFNEKDKPITLLSSGQKQLAMIIQALIQNSHITIFDEPISNLDPLNTKKIFDILKSCEYFKTKIVITHDMNFAYNLGYKILYLKDKKIVFFGECAEFFSKEKLVEFFDDSIIKTDEGILVRYA
ncbi:MAG: cobalamin transport system ATP-binding protein [Campylobacterota bacterium]|nr:cobalamin transport system ATP-binding protein [Campylobacterota bacterium]